MAHRSHTEAPNFNPVLWWSTVVGICAIIACGSIFVTLSYLKKRKFEIEHPRPAYLAKLPDFTATNRDGGEVSFSQLEGDIWVAGYQYTGCPGGCLGMAGIMKNLYDKFGDRDDFHLVSISLDPKEDTPAKMDAWVKRNGIDVENWWFLTGNEERIREYMIRNFKFFGVVENTDPEEIARSGKFSHDQRLALVDGAGHVRGMYDVMNTTQPGMAAASFEQLVSDICYLFEESGKPLPAGAGDPYADAPDTDS
ncbi:MAG: SCO family protein [Verrucomicrobiae bacterium]|nr:SCO family protein [Verrucomicrobiae bacterium]